MKIEEWSQSSEPVLLTENKLIIFQFSVISLKNLPDLTMSLLVFLTKIFSAILPILTALKKKKAFAMNSIFVPMFF